MGRCLGLAIHLGCDLLQGLVHADQLQAVAVVDDPGCTVPGYGCQVHHAAKDWKDGGSGNIDALAFACKCDNLLVENGGWLTKKRKDGTTEWIPPPQLPMIRGGTNDFHHPERLLGNDDDAA